MQFIPIRGAFYTCRMYIEITCVKPHTHTQELIGLPLERKCSKRPMA